MSVSFRCDTFKTGNCLSVLNIVKKEPGKMLSLFIKGFLNCYLCFQSGHVLSLRYVIREFFMFLMYYT